MAQYVVEAGPSEQSTLKDTCVDDQLPQEYSPSSQLPKNVAFELLLDENSKVRARIPMRVNIYPHDTTESIVTTVKNFYGIYDGAASGVKFEDERGATLIARYDNLINNMTIYVRVIPVPVCGESHNEHPNGSAAPESRKRPSLAEPFQMPPSIQTAHVLEHGQVPSRPTSRVAMKRSASPSGRSRRSASQNKQSSRAGNKSRNSSTHGSFFEDGASGYSDSECGPGSIAGTRKARSEQFASSEISMDNILQDGRRKRPKFESSELPLFAPPQVPLTASTSSISPQRRSIGQEGACSPFARPAHRPYGYQQPLPSPQSYGYNENVYGFSSTATPIYATPAVPEHGHRLRERSGGQASTQFANSMNRLGGPGILPTPDPTIASCISDEDVAMQLIRLGDASNFSHGRTSASTLDDAFSGVADAASSTGATSDGEDYSDDENDGDDDLPFRSRQKLDSSPMLPPGAIRREHKGLDEILPSFDSTDVSGDELDEGYRRETLADGLVKSELYEDSRFSEIGPKAKKARGRSVTTSAPKPAHSPKIASKPNKGAKAASSATTGGVRKNKTASSSSSSVAAVYQKAASGSLDHVSGRKVSGSSAALHQLAADEEDLSTKPRCQRCRKSKKGCDRQRPCGRCRDAGIGLEGCLSEDEGNGRKGRYGRHMGVPIKKVYGTFAPAINTVGSNGIGGISDGTMATMSITPLTMDKNKKRKR